MAKSDEFSTILNGIVMPLSATKIMELVPHPTYSPHLNPSDYFWL